MKVCHVYNQDNPQLARYVSMLCAAMPADVVCVAEGDGSTPDIVHLHGQAAFKLPKGARLVVSPHGETPGDSRAYATLPAASWRPGACTRSAQRWCRTRW